ncbi:MAG: cystathionine gamma-synthase [Gammaproteobacteria bacterium]
MSTRQHFATIAARQGLGSDQQHGAVVSPIHLSSTFQFDGLGAKRQYDYSRSGNPTRDELATTLAALEEGAGGVVTSSGMAALTLVCQLLNADDLLIAPHDCYGGTHRLLTHLEKQKKLRVRFVNQTDPLAVADALSEKPRLVLCETPSNPLLRITDIKWLADLAHKAGALLAVDNTFLSPGWQKPITLGADLVVHSTTKYINGHSDVVGGAVIAATDKLHEEICWWANCIGITGAPFDSFLALRGLRTLPSRLAAHARNAKKIVDCLCGDSRIKQVNYPGLESHPGHAIAKRQQTGFGAMVSFEVDCNAVDLKTFIESLELFFLAESLGGVESLVAHPASMTHAAMTPEARNIAGITEGLVRISIGLEHDQDLIDDINQALDKATLVRTDCADQINARYERTPQAHRLAQ